MLFFFSATVIFLIGVFLQRFVTEWLANRPERGPEFSPEEILAEMDEAFVARDVLTFSIRPDSVKVLLHRLTEGVGLGFGARHADGLAYRIMHQHMQDFYQAAYPVEVNGQASDLEFQWCREDEESVRIAICAVEDVLRYATDAIADLAIEHRPN